MRLVSIGLVGLAAMAFLLAVTEPLLGRGLVGNIAAEGFSRACTNLALIAIALGVWFPRATEDMDEKRRHMGWPTKR